MNKNFAYIISTLFGAGYFPKAPGTFGSFVSLPVIFLVSYCFGLWGLLAMIIFVFAIAVPAIKKVLLYTEHDPSFIVVDEFIGQSVTFLFVVDVLKNNISLKALVIYTVGFILFRIFDVRKPYPVSYADQKIKNEFGVILDDIFAGVYAAIFLTVFVYFVYKFFKIL